MNLTMISSGVIAALVFNIAICVLLPVIGFLFVQVTAKKAIKPFFLGAAAFFVSQIMFRIPLLTQVLAKMPWYIDFSAKRPFLCSLFVGISAGVFEETARLICFGVFMKKNRRFADSVAFGFGHGGIEAILLTGLSCLSTLQYCLMINSGTFHTLQAVLPQGLYEGIYQSCITATAGTVMLGGAERIFAMGLHIGFTTLIWKGLQHHQIWRYFTAAILLHGMVDASVGFMSRAGVSIIIIEAVLFIVAALFIVYTISQGKKEVVCLKK